MKNARSRFLAIVVTLAMVLSLFPASLASAAGKTTLKTKSITLQEGKTATIVLTNKKKTTYTFTSSNKSVATVTKAGKVTAVKAGSASIVVKEKSKKIGTVSVKVTKAKAEAAPTKAEAAPVGYAVDLSTVKGDGASFDNGTATAKNCTFSFTLETPLSAGDVITVTVKGKYNGSKGFRSWVIDDNQTTMSDIADTSVFPSAAGDFTATYKLTATGAATRLFFKGPSWQDANVDDVTIKSISIAK